MSRKFKKQGTGERLPVKQDIGPSLKLIRHEQSAIGQASARILEMDDAADARLERLAKGVEQVGQRR